MQKTIGHKASQPGLRGHSHDPEQDLMKQYVVVRKLPTGGNLWVASFDTVLTAKRDVLPRSANERYIIIDQFNDNEIVWEDIK